MFFWWSSTKIVQAVWIRQKTWPPGGRAYFPYICIYIENFKNLLVRNHWTDFNITWKECVFGHPLPRLFKPSWFVKKYGCKGVGLIFPIYLYRKQNLLVRNHWTDFSIFGRNVSLVTLYQDCSGCHDLSKNMAARGWGLFSLYIYIENLKKIFLSETTGLISI